MDGILHHLRNPGNDESPINTNEQWFPIVSWVVQDFVLPHMNMQWSALGRGKSSICCIPASGENKENNILQTTNSATCLRSSVQQAYANHQDTSPMRVPRINPGLSGLRIRGESYHLGLDLGPGDFD